MQTVSSQIRINTLIYSIATILHTHTHTHTHTHDLPSYLDQVYPAHQTVAFLFPASGL